MSLCPVWGMSGFHNLVMFITVMMDNFTAIVGTKVILYLNLAYLSSDTLLDLYLEF